MTNEEFTAFISPERVVERERGLAEILRISEEADAYPELNVPPNALELVHAGIVTPTGDDL